jgi:probable HAF family extracellular repeat protein
MQDLGTLGGKGGFATGINNLGQVVGGAYTSSGAQHAFLYTNGTMQDLGTFGGAQSAAVAINNLGQVVGEADTSSGTSAPFLYSNGTMQDLNSLIPSNSGWTLENITGINDKGQICGQGINPSGQGDAFLLTPESSVPEPSSFVAWCGLTSIGLAMAWRRRKQAA